MDEPAVEGVGDRLKWSTGLAESENERDKKGWVVDELAGKGVETPSALANLANRWGGNGDFGGRQVGDNLAETGDRHRGVPFPFSLDIMIFVSKRKFWTN
jgi:hypothetical protein